jgi:hypothetical protein
LSLNVSEKDLVVRGAGHVLLYNNFDNDGASLLCSERTNLSIDCCGYIVPENDSVSESNPIYGMHSSGYKQNLYISEKELESLEAADGPYVMAIVDGDRSECILRRDKFGQRQLYYYIDNGRLWFSDNIRVLNALKSSVLIRPGAML